MLAIHPDYLAHPPDLFAVILFCEKQLAGHVASNFVLVCCSFFFCFCFISLLFKYLCRQYSQ